MKYACLAASLTLILLAGCDQLKEAVFHTKLKAELKLDQQLDALQAAIEPVAGAQAVSPSIACVLAVVDSHWMAKAGEGAETSVDAENAASRREREVRQALNKLLVDNLLIEVVQPTTDQEQQVRQAIIAANSAALDVALASSVGLALGAGFVVCAVIDDEGGQVNIAVQETKAGMVVFQDTLVNWEPAKGAAPATPAAGKAGP